MDSGMGRYRRAVAGGVIWLVVVGLGGCSSGGGAGEPAGAGAGPSLPGAGPVATVGASVAASSSPGSPSSLPREGAGDVVAAMPAAARRRTAAGAEAFVSYVLQVSNEVAIHPRVGLLTALATSSCGTCRGWEDDTRALIERKRHYAGPALTVRQIAGLDGRPQSDAFYRVGARVRQGGFPLVDDRGQLVRAIPTSDGTLIFYLTWHGSSWLVDKIKLLDPG